MRKHAEADADRYKPEHVRRVTPNFTDNARAKPGVGTASKELVIELRPRLARAKYKIFTLQICQPK
jgi:hypothetical protein